MVLKMMSVCVVSKLSATENETLTCPPVQPATRQAYGLFKQSDKHFGLDAEQGAK